MSRNNMWRFRFLVTIISFCWIPWIINGTTNEIDVTVLNDMYTSLRSPSQLVGWSSNPSDPCGQSWKGITCSGSSVTEIKLSGLGISGSIGFQLDKMSSLTSLDLSNNNLANSIPYQLPPNLQYLDLSGNTFSGTVPYSISYMVSLRYINLSRNQLNGPLNEMFQKLQSLNTIDFSFNALTGTLPENFKDLLAVKTMYLQNNQFSGSINVLANLPLETLNVANNHFNGWIPNELKKIKSLTTDGNSWNSGSAPPPPPYTSPPSGTKTNPENNGSEGGKSGISGGGIAGIVISLLIVGIVVAFFLVKWKRRSSMNEDKLGHVQPFAPLSVNKAEETGIFQSSDFPMKEVHTSVAFESESNSVINLKPPPIERYKSFDEEDFSVKINVREAIPTPLNVTVYSIADLQITTGSFSHDNLVGEGTIGRVYRAQFSDGKVLAVKKLDTSVIPSQQSEDFLELLSKISRFHHPNITELVGYCCEHGQHLLVYEFHRNGSLHDFFHHMEYKSLTWSSRISIALGTARALEYLHEICSPSIVLKNFNSANILLDLNLNPHISDCGLATFIPFAEQQASNHYKNSGYIAPEVTMSGQYTMKSDVYSFGVVMLELLTGRKPFDSSRTRSEQFLVQWATPQLHDIEALAEMVDPELKGQYSPKSLSRFADVIALCVQGEPEFRPLMSEVVVSIVRLLQRDNMSKRTTAEQGRAHTGNDAGNIQD